MMFGFHFVSTVLLTGWYVLNLDGSFSLEIRSMLNHVKPSLCVFSKSQTQVRLSNHQI